MNPFGQPSAVTPAPPPSFEVNRKHGASVVVAVVLFVGGIVAVVAGIAMLIAAIIDTATESGVRSDALVEIALPGVAVVDLDAGSYVALALGEGLVRSTYDPVRDLRVAERGPFAAPRVTVTDPSGGVLELRNPRFETLEDRPGTDAASIVEFTVRDSGDHTISVQPAPDSTGGPVTSVVVRSSSVLDAFGFRDFVIGFGLAFAGGTAVLLGVLLGVVSLVRRRR